MNDDSTRIMTLARSVEFDLDEKVHCLELVEGADVGRRFVVGAAPVVIGRIAPADIVVADSEVSRSHCRVAMQGDELIVTDLNSTNGAYIDGQRLAEPMALPVGSILQIGRTALIHEWLTDKQWHKSEALDRDLAVAASYVNALLPPRIQHGPVRADWLYRPCAKLGGDALGYQALSDTLFAVYLIDVSGHGAGAAMHSVSIMNVLRQRALPSIDFTAPGQVLAALNDMFQMDQHADMYFTMWYGVYDATRRTVEFASGGHHPGFIVDAERLQARPLQARNAMIGATPGRGYKSDTAFVPPESSIYLFSDGAFEIVTNEGLQWRLDNFTPLLLEPAVEGLSEPERLFRAVGDISRVREPDDDVSIVVLNFD